MGLRLSHSAEASESSVASGWHCFLLWTEKHTNPEAPPPQGSSALAAGRGPWWERRGRRLTAARPAPQLGGGTLPAASVSTSGLVGFGWARWYVAQLPTPPAPTQEPSQVSPGAEVMTGSGSDPPATSRRSSGSGVRENSQVTSGVGTRPSPPRLPASLAGGAVRAGLPEAPGPALGLLPPGAGADRQRHRLGTRGRGSEVSPAPSHGPRVGTCARAPILPRLGWSTCPAVFPTAGVPSFHEDSGRECISRSDCLLF